MNLFVGNLHPETNAANLRTLFSQFGEIVSAKVIMDNATGVSRGFGFVEMGDKYHAMDAIDNLDQTFFEGNIISVKEAKQNNTSKGGGNFRQGGGGGYRQGGGGGGYRQGGGSGGNRPFKPRTPRPGGWNNDNNGGGGWNNNNNNSGGWNSNNNNNNSGNWNNNNSNSGNSWNNNNNSNNSNDSYNNNRY